MAITIEKKFQLRSPLENAWSFIADPTRIAVCLPGVELTEVIDAVTYTGNVRVKVGPMIVAYAGEARLTERNEAARTFRMVGKGKERGGAGSAKMELFAAIAEVDGGVEVEVKSTIDLTGKVVRFGRGMIEAVSDQLFEEFVANVRANLETEKALVRAAEPASAPSSEPEPPRETSRKPESERGPPSDAPAASKPAASLARPSEPVAALALLIRVVRAMFKRFFAWIFGRSRKGQA